MTARGSVAGMVGLLVATTAWARLPQGIVAADRVEAVTELVFTEGPAADADGSIYFTDIANNRIMRLPAGAQQAEVFLEPSNRANGLMFDRDGQLLACEGNERGAGDSPGRRLVRIDPKTKKRTVIADRYLGKRFNSPNDLCIDGKGRIYFTDPYYGPHRDKLELDVEGIYRVDADGKNLTRVLGKSRIKRPNGIAISADDRTLYVVDNYPIPPASRLLLAFDISSDGSLSNRRVLHDFGSGRGGDGMAIDAKGNLYVAAGANRPYPNQSTANPAGVYVFSPKGTWLGTIPVTEDMCTNCCFGGPDKKTLYITSGKTVWSIPVAIPGRSVWPTVKR